MGLMVSYLTICTRIKLLLILKVLYIVHSSLAFVSGLTLPEVVQAR